MPTTDRVVAGQPESPLPSGASGEPITFTTQNLNTAAQPVVFTTDDLAWGKLLFTVTNSSTEVVTLSTASVLTVYLDSLLTDNEIGKIERATATWSGGPVKDDFGQHLSFSPKAAITLPPSQSVEIEVTGALAAGLPTTGYFIFGYTGFKGVPDGESRIQGFRQATPASTIPWPLGFSWAPRQTYQNNGNSVYVTPWTGQAGISNSFVLQIQNTQSSAIPIPANATPRIVVSFVAGSTLLSLCSDEQLKTVDAAVTQSDWPWTVTVDKNGPLPIFIFTPNSGNLDLFNGGGVLAITFSGLVTDLAPGYASPVFVQYAGDSTYQDGYSSLIINKTAPVPYVTQFDVSTPIGPVSANQIVPYGPVTVTWAVFATQSCILQGFPDVFAPSGSFTFTPSGIWPVPVTCHLQSQIGSVDYDGGDLSFFMEGPPPVQVSISASADNPVPGPHGVWNVSVSWSTVNATSAEVWCLDNGGEIGTDLSGSWGTSGMSPLLHFKIKATGPGGTAEQDCTASLD